MDIISGLNCEFCNKLCKNTNSLTQHSIRCKSNPNRIIVKSFFADNQEKVIERRRELGYTNKYTKAKALGLPKPIISQETRELLSKRSSEHRHSEATKEKISNSMRLAVEKYPDSYSANNVCGRVKVQTYKGNNFHGNWEVLVAKWFDNNGISWLRDIKPIEYIWKDKIHLYFPDFYLPEYDLYVEVKGYETERDRCKWKVLDNLLIIKKKEINLIKTGNYKI